MNTIKFRCSSLGKLMTNHVGKSNADKYTDAVETLNSLKEKYEATKNKETATAIKMLDKIKALEIEVPELFKVKDDIKLSETAKTHIEEIWLKRNHGYKETVITNEIIKGIVCEKEAIELLTEFDSEVREKNNKRFDNDFIEGEPDVILSEVIEDTKCSWNLKTYFNAELSDEYFWQGQGYMALLGIKKFRLVYCGIDTPPELITKEINYQVRKLGMSITEDVFDAEKIATQIRKNHTFSHLPIEKRIKVFEFEYNESDINKLYKTIDAARIYYNSISL